MVRILMIILPVLLGHGFLMAQDSRTVGDQATVIARREAGPQNRKAALRAFNNHPINRYYDRLIVEYEERMRANAKKYKVMARKMKKPRYSDPSYFGHKRKPKKRPVGKRKYCQECELVH